MAVVKGTSISEILNGTAEDDKITGGAGNDVLNGGKGQDTAIYAGNSSDFRFSWNIWNSGVLTITDLNTSDGDAGTDSLQGIEYLQFTDRTLTLQAGGEQLVSPLSVNEQISGEEISTTPTVHLQDGGWIVSWHGYNQDKKQDIYTQRYDSLGNAIGDAIRISTNTGYGKLSPIATALPDGGWLITWEGQGAGDIQGIFSQRFDQNGVPLAGEIQVNTTTARGQTSPCVTVLDDGGWLVAWESQTSDNRYSIVAQRYDASGSLLGSELTLATKYFQSSSNVQALPDGGWLTIWCNEGPGSEYGTFIQRFDSTGSPVGDLHHLAYRPLDPSPPSVVIQPDGGWTLLYEQYPAATYYSVAIFAQNYDAAGNSVGAASLIGSTPYGPNEVLALPNNNWLVAWDSGNILYFQRYDSTGNRIGSETAVNIDRFSSRADVFSTTLLPDGGWIFTWADGENHAGDENIYTQRYDKNGNRLRLEVQGTDSNDTLISSDSNIALAGGAGDDVYILGSSLGAMSGSAASIREAANGGLDTVLSYLYHYELAENIENGRILNTDHYAYLIGNSLDNILYSNSNSNYLDGGIGSDTADFSYATSGISINLNDEYKFISIENATGSSYADYIAGNSSNNILNGAAGSDTVNYATATSAVNVSLAISTAQVTGGGGTDTLISIENLIGSDFNDTLAGNSGNNTLNGAAGSDTVNYAAATSAVNVSLAISTAQVTGGGGTDTLISIENLTGSDFSDTLAGNSGNNTLNGAAGSDTVSYATATSAVHVSLAISTAQVTGGGGTDTLISIENLSGSAHNDRLTGDDAANKLSGGAGNDILNGGAGADKLIGGDGSDIYYVDSTSDVISETNANLSIGGNDTVYSYLSEYTLGTNIENGRVLAGDTSSLIGNSLNNILYAGAGNNVLNGGAGSDTVSYLYASSAVTVTLASAAAQATGGSDSDMLIAIENLTGSSYNDSLTGDAADNTLSGGAGDDILNGRAGADKLIGGDGSDIYYVDNASDLVSETNASLSTGGSDTVYSYLSKYTLGANIENGRIVAGGNASLTGNSLNNILYAGAGSNVLNGGTGSDSVSYLYASSAVTVTLASSAAQATGGSGSDTLIAIESLIGSNYNDKLTGNSASNRLSGGLGNDVLNGGAGSDKMIGGEGSDTYYVDNAGDVVSETNADASTGGTDTVYSYLTSYSLGTNIENGRILAAGSANLSGNNLNNVLVAGIGNNILNGSDGTDTVSYTHASSAVTVSLNSTSAQATKGSGSDTLISIENLAGSQYNDSLTGNAASNTLNGGAGNDRLIGGAGKDLLIGGAGNDTFVINALSDSGLTSDNWDVIKDFMSGDKIDLSRLDADTTVDGNNVFTQIIDSAAAFTAAGQLRLTDGVLYGNIDGDADAEFAIQLVGVTSVSLADFTA